MVGCRLWRSEGLQNVRLWSSLKGVSRREGGLRKSPEFGVEIARSIPQRLKPD